MTSTRSGSWIAQGIAPHTITHAVWRLQSWRTGRSRANEPFWVHERDSLSMEWPFDAGSPRIESLAAAASLLAGARGRPAPKRHRRKRTRAPATPNTAASKQTLSISPPSDMEGVHSGRHRTANTPTEPPSIARRNGRARGPPMQRKPAPSTAYSTMKRRRSGSRNAQGIAPHAITHAVWRVQAS